MKQLQFGFIALSLLLSNFFSAAQSNTVASGGAATGTGGTVSYSIGQIDYISATGVGGTASQGVQQVYKLHLSLKAFIQGYYDINLGLMTPVLYNQGQPNGLNDADTVTVELHHPTAPFALAHSYTGVLKTNGMITCSFPNASAGQTYYVVLKHRNTLQTWSANPLVLSDALYDFTTHANKAYGNNQVLVGANTYAMFSGDINQDENVDLLDAGIQEVDVTNFAYGYYATDINGDGNVDLLDNVVLEGNVNDFIYSNHP